MILLSTGEASQRAFGAQDTCVENGGTAICVGPELGPFLYQVSDGNFVAQGATEAGTIAAYNAQVNQYYHPCTFTQTNNLPAWPSAGVGNGSANSGNYTQALYNAVGQYWSISWTFSTERNSTIIPLANTITYGSNCGTSRGPWGAYVQRVRADQCPALFNANFTAPSNSYCYRGPSAGFDPKKSLGPCPEKATGGCSTLIGDPVNPYTGNNFQGETDYLGPGPMPLALVRYYNSQLYNSGASALGPQSGFGPSWRSTYDRAVSFENSTYATAYVYRPEGGTLRFKLAGGQFIPEADVSDKLVQLVDGSGNITGWTYTVAANDDVETYNASGALISITSRSGLVQTISYDSNLRLSTVADSFGRTLTFTYNSSGQLSTMTDPAGKTYSYTYTSVGNVASVTYPDGAVRTYKYNESADTGGLNFPYAMTGIVDEDNVRYATFQYGGTGNATSSSHAGGADSYSFTYNGSSTSTITDPLGTVRIFGFSTILGVPKNKSLDKACPVGCAGAQASTTYDANGNIANQTDFNGYVTTHSYDLTRNLETSRTEASGTANARTITTSWNSNYREPTSTSVYAGGTATGTPLRTTSYTYDSSGNVLTKTSTDASVTPNVARTWTYTYDSYGRVLTAQSPRTDVNSTTTYTYYTCTTGYQCGELNTVTDPVGNVTTYNTYNAYGQPLTITDPNGVVTTLTYDNRLRLTSRQVGSETTSFSYYPTGLLKTITLPDSSTITYTYDNAHRLIKIADSLGNYISYTLDAMGNRTAEQSYDPSSTLHRTHTRTFTSLDQLYQDINAAGTSAVTTTYTYDGNSNQTGIAAPLTRNTTDAYDQLNRLNQITDPNSGVTKFTYDAADDLTSVQDPRSLTTSYSYNGFGDVTQLVSPDTGTSTNTYDSAGNLSVATDARGSTANYSYDAANRVTQIVYKDNTGTTDQTLTFGYDSGTYGKGRLTGSGDGNHALSWTYDFAGRVTGKGLTVGTLNLSVGYGYTNGDLTAITTPSGQTVTYSYNTNHQVTGISVNSTTVLGSVSYEPFGGVNGWTWGDSTTVNRTFNGDGLISQIVTAGVTLGYTFDNANRITGISDSSSSALTWTYGYDVLDRLTSASTTANSYGWTYDANGNRTAQTTTGATTFSVSSTSNQLSSTTGSLVRTYLYDAAGHTQGYGSYTFGYNNRGRMAGTSAGSTQYLYNALGQMYEKSGTAGTTYLMYDEAGHIIGEYGASGNLIEETVWLGDIPVATLQPNGSGGVNIFYIHTDHLNAPRKISQPTTGTLAWRWDTDPFGMAAPNQNPGGLGTFIYNLRMPGQYYQSETGLNQNINRDYDPLTGGYIESDLIGLAGGNLSTYGYSNGSPVDRADPSGLFSLSPAAIEAALKRAGLAEAVGGGPEDPVGDAAALVLGFATIVAATDTATSPTTSAAAGCPPNDPCKGLRDTLKEHEKKLSDYIKDPLASDNLGILAEAYAMNDLQRAHSIYNGRVNNLMGQIENFKKLLEECERQNGKR